LSAADAGDCSGDQAQLRGGSVLTAGEQAHAHKGAVGVSAAPTKTGKFHATFRRAIGLLHPAGSSSAQSPLSFNDEHFCRREQRPAKPGKQIFVADADR
jgi:hypothetical protein